jgi:hypothetical protein
MVMHDEIHRDLTHTPTFPQIRSLRRSSDGKPPRPASSTPLPWRHRLSPDPVLFTYAKPRLSRIYYHVINKYLYAGTDDVKFLSKPSSETC